MFEILMFLWPKVSTVSMQFKVGEIVGIYRLAISSILKNISCKLYLFTVVKAQYGVALYSKTGTGTGLLGYAKYIRN